MREKIAVQMKEPSFNENDAILVVKFQIKFKPACESSALEKIPLHGSFGIFTCSVLSAITIRLILSSVNVSTHRRTVTSYTKVVTLLLRLYVTDTMITKVDNNIKNFRKEA